MSTVDPLSANASTSSGNSLGAMSSGDFFKLILTELSKQDPLKPNDTNALLQQISAVRSIQSNMDLSTDLKSLVNQNEFASASTLVGKMISGVDENFERVDGLVKSISRTSDGTVLTLSTGERVNIGNVDEIRATPAGGG